MDSQTSLNFNPGRIWPVPCERVSLPTNDAQEVLDRRCAIPQHLLSFINSHGGRLLNIANRADKYLILCHQART